MGWAWRVLGRPVLALQDSEKAHSRAMWMLKVATAVPPTRWMLRVLYRPRRIKTTIMGWNLDNPIGLAAGMDKKAENILGWENLGFGFIEVGGFTALEQAGNPRPRMFRNSGHSALINRMGFNNPGSEKAAATLAAVNPRRRGNMRILANLGRSKVCSNEEAADDYSTSLRRLWKHVDGFVVNVSSPNTPGLRELQEGDALGVILRACIATEKDCGGEKPVLIKVAPDLEDEQLDHIIEVARECGCAGIVATNTTVDRPQPLNSRSERFLAETGGLSGAPLASRSTEIIAHVYRQTKGEWPIIGVGGISTAEDAWEKVTNGASAIQFYSALIFEGAGVIRQIQKGLAARLKAHGFTSLDEAVGLAHRSDTE